MEPVMVGDRREYSPWRADGRRQPEPPAPSPREFTSLYVHVPFCREKCDYCAFDSIPRAGHALKQAYLARLEQEFERFASQTTPLNSVYIGGGTPTALASPQLDRLWNAVGRHFRLREDGERTVECNPGSLTAEHLRVLARHAVNRISLGIQSLDRKTRTMLGRKGDPDPLQVVLKRIRDAGIARISVDLIYGVPGQGIEEWRKDLVNVLDNGVEHLSAYALTIEPGTPLASRVDERPEGDDDERILAMWAETQTICKQYGLQRYEVSNFAKPGAESRHNLAVWHGGTYLGCGPAAASFDGVDRRRNPPSLEDWLHGRQPEVDRLPPRARAAEILAFGLRTDAGWNLDEFRRRTGFCARALRGRALDRLVEHGLLQHDENRIRPTEKGMRLNDTVLAELL